VEAFHDMLRVSGPTTNFSITMSSFVANDLLLPLLRVRNRGVRFVKYDFGSVFGSVLQKPAVFGLVFTVSRPNSANKYDFHILACKATVKLGYKESN